MYPAITELTLLYYSVLNTLAKIVRRRVTDALFAPTILLLISLHFFRDSLGLWRWLEIADRFLPTLVTSDEMTQLRLGDFFSTNIALRLNGGITSLFIIKLAILGVSLISLVLSRPLPVQRNVASSLSGIETALATRANNVAGLGRSHVYEIQRDGSLVADVTSSAVFSPKRDQVHPSGLLALNSYELVRLGFVVYGDEYLISMDDWDRVSMLAGFRQLYHLWNHRVIVLELQASTESPSLVEASQNPRLMRVDAPELQRISIWAISARAIKC